MKKMVILGILLFVCMISSVKADLKYFTLKVVSPDTYIIDEIITFQMYEYETGKLLGDYNIYPNYFFKGKKYNFYYNTNKVIIKSLLDNKYLINSNDNNVIDFLDNKAEYTLKYDIQYTDVSFKNYYVDKVTQNYISDYRTNITIFDSDHNKYGEAIDNVTLHPGFYYFKDNISNQEQYLEIFGTEFNLTFTYELSKNFYVNKKIDSICKDDYCYKFEQLNNALILDEYLLPDKYIVTSNNCKYLVDLTDNYEFVFDALYEETIKVENETQEIIVNVPDTGL